MGADPDGGMCDSALGWHIDNGTIQGVDVSGLTIALSVHIPGNVLKGNWRALVYVDEKRRQRSKTRFWRYLPASWAVRLPTLPP